MHKSWNFLITIASREEGKFHEGPKLNLAHGWLQQGETFWLWNAWLHRWIKCYTNAILSKKAEKKGKERAPQKILADGGREYVNIACS